MVEVEEKQVDNLLVKFGISRQVPVAFGGKTIFDPYSTGHSYES